MTQLELSMDKVRGCLVQFTKRAKAIVEKGLNKGEANVTNFLVNPLLHCLEWDTTNPEYVLPQYPIRMGTATKFVDYSLLSDGKPVCLIEIKDKALTEDDVGQLLSYCNSKRVIWGILTNGVEVWFYDTSLRGAEKLVFKTDILEDSKKMLETIPYLCRSHLCSSDPSAAFRQMNLKRRTITIVKGEGKALIQKVTEWLKDKLGVDSIPEDIVKEAARQVFGFPSREASELRVVVRPTELIVTTAGDWRHNPQLGRGVFEYKRDPSKRIDVSKPGRQVEEKLTQLGLKCSTTGAFGGFYYDLRRRADLIKRQY